MTKLNPTATDFRVDLKAPRLAGGYGPQPARQDPEALLKRAVMACLLWENLAYETGSETVAQIKMLVPQVDAAKVAEIAIEARQKQKLRHVPLLLAVEMSKYPETRRYVAEVLAEVCTRPDMLTDFLALYYADRGGKHPLAAQVQIGLGRAWYNFDAYQLAKWNELEKKVKLRDVMRLTHPKPLDSEQAALWKALLNGKLPVADTWEHRLAEGEDKKSAWAALIETGKLPALAFLRNLDNLEKVGVSRETIRLAFEKVRSNWLLPLDFFKAAQHAPAWTREIEALMLRTYERVPKLPGWTVFVVDVSNSMNSTLSDKSKFTRLDAAAAMAVLAAETCEQISLYATAGNDGTQKHQTTRLAPFRGFALADLTKRIQEGLGGGGIFTRQCLEWIYADLHAQTPDRIIVFSDSQDCDLPDRRMPAPFGKHNYIVDVSAHRHGVAYAGLWDAEVSGWSEHFLAFIGALEGLASPEAEAAQ